MTTKYSVKKCNTFGFAQSLADSLTLLKQNDNEVIYLHDSNENKTEETKLNDDKALNLLRSKYPLTECETIENLTTPPNKKATIIVELGYTKNKVVKRPLEFDDSEIITNFTCEDSIDAITQNEFKHIILNTINDELMLKERKISKEFILYIINLYPHLRDYNLKVQLLNLLEYNNFSTFDLEKEYPFEYKDEIIASIETSTPFSDIEVSVDKNDKNTSTSQYRADKDALKNAALGKATQLDAFSENKFAIIHTKKKAGIENIVRNQNHDVLDNLAVNGVMKAPDTSKPLSIYNLMIKLENFDSFDIIFIHPSYEVRCMSAEYPCEQIIPSYRIGEGEILAVAFRYIVIHFFGYCSIFTDSMLEWRYYF